MWSIVPERVLYLAAGTAYRVEGTVFVAPAGREIDFHVPQ